MGLVAPLALLGLLAVPLIVAFYMLRLRRPQRPVSSTLLWQELVRDVEANAPWQRLRRSLLLALQLLLAVFLAVLVSRPFLERPAGLARDLVLVVDASASMAATDVFPDRLTAAKRLAIEALADVPADGRVSVVAAGETARVMANEATDRGRVARAIEGIEQSTAAGDLTDALQLAGRLAERARGAEILVVTDDAASSVPAVSLDVPVRAMSVGRERDNQAIAALAVRADPSGLKQTVFISVANYSSAEVVRRLQLLADGTLYDSRDVTLRPLSRADVVIEQLPSGTRTVEARIAAPVENGGAMAGPSDRLALDDAAWAIVPPTDTRFILLVGPGNVYLQNALALLPNVELYGTTAENYAATAASPEFAEYDLVVFDGFLPPSLPDKAILAFAPPSTSELGVVAGTLDEDFGLGQLPLDEPLLRGVDLSRLHIARTQQMDLPEWARPIIPGTDGPLLYSGLREGLPTTVFAFDSRHSDLPLQVAWPILLSNVAGELLGIGPVAPEALAPAQPIELPLAPGALGVRVTLPDGSVEELAPGATGAGSLTFVSTRQLGVYRAELIPDPAASPEPSAPPTVSPQPGATPSADPSGGPSVAPGTADELLLFAVNLFSHDESNIQPGDGARLETLGGQDGGDEVEAGLARDEFWPWLVLLVLGFLVAEWLVYERDGARRIAGWLRGGLAGLRARRTA
ncbi:MAG TPA: VWA domain-containing protein [Candidatus Limnocylindria bacterium]|nr:VWA domain-containing protein [Candidatus Limnocylindria bacterium]